MPFVQTNPEYSPASPASAADDPRALWHEIVRCSLEACISRKDGREAEVAVLLQKRLPPLIRDWSNSCGLPSETCKQNLRSLFQRIEESVESCYLNRRLVVEDVCARLSGAASTPAAPVFPAAAVVPSALIPPALPVAPASPIAPPAPAVSIGSAPAPAPSSSPAPAPLPRFFIPSVPPSLSSETGPLHLRQRVAIDDVSGMLDAVVAAEREIRGKAVLRVRRSSRAMLHLFSGHASSPAVLPA